MIQSILKLLKAKRSRWGPWSPWGKCSGSCMPAFRVRHRDPERFPNHCGMPALGLEDEYEMCEYLQELSHFIVKYMLSQVILYIILYITIVNDSCDIAWICMHI